MAHIEFYMCRIKMPAQYSFPLSPHHSKPTWIHVGIYTLYSWSKKINIYQYPILRTKMISFSVLCSWGGEQRCGVMQRISFQATLGIIPNKSCCFSNRVIRHCINWWPQFHTKHLGICSGRRAIRHSDKSHKWALPLFTVVAKKTWDTCE